MNETRGGVLLVNETRENLSENLAMDPCEPLKESPDSRTVFISPDPLVDCCELRMANWILCSISA